MAAGDEKGDDFYAVMGLNKECSSQDLRNAYKKLAMRWHPDRCSASRNIEFVEEAKTKFQEIQEAYSVLSDSNKRFLYDVGVYDNDDDENGMGDFLGEMAAMMKQTKPSDNKKESFEDLQDLFMEMFQGDMNRNSSFGDGPSMFPTDSNGSVFPMMSSSSSGGFTTIQGLKRDSADMTFGRSTAASADVFETARQFSSGDGTFCFGMSDSGTSSMKGGGNGGSRRRSGRKQKVSSRHDVSSRDAGGISAS